METSWLHGPDLHAVSLTVRDGVFTVLVDGKERRVEARRISPHWISLNIDDESFNVYVARDREKRYIAMGGEHYVLSLPDRDDAAVVSGAGGIHGEAKLMLSAPMPGSVLKINVSQGDSVSEGDCLAIVEAMKMETGLHAAVSGRVKRVCVKAGQQVDAGELLIELEESGSAGEK